MPVPPPDESLHTVLRRLGDHGVRAERFLDSAAKHLNDPGPDAAVTQHVAYALREALMAIVERGGVRPRGVREAAQDVVRRWEAAGDVDQLVDSIRRLAEVLEGPGPNAERLERALSDLAGLRPTRGSADLIERFVVALDTAARWLHARMPPAAADVAALYEETIMILRELFGPMSERLAAMDELVGHREPGLEEVVLLRQRLGDERHLVYLFDCAEGPGWFHALREDPLLLPPADRPWTAAPYVARIAQSDTDDVRVWLARLAPSDLNARQAAELLRIARLTGGDVGRIARDLARNHLGDGNVRMHADALIRELSPQQRDTPEVRSLMQRLLTSTLAERGGSLDAYMAAEQLALAVAAAAGPNAAAWLKMLAYRTCETANAEEPLRLRVLLPLSELSLTGARRPVELAVAALRRAAVASADSGLSLDERLDQLQIVPQPLADRLVAQHLLDRLPETDPQARAFICAQAATNVWPSAEELSLLRRLLDAGPGAHVFARDVAAALGRPPSADEIEALADAETRPDDLVRAHRWLVAIPPDAAPEWHVADEQLGAHLGPASPDGVMMRSSAARFVGPTTPIDTAQLTALTPLQAAKRVAAWRPEQPASFLGPSAEGLSSTLRQAIDAGLDAWLALDPVQIAEALREPLYIAVFIDALTSNAPRMIDRAERVLALTELVRSEPWPADDLGPELFGQQNTWLRADDAALQLLGRLGELNAIRDELADRAWAQIVDAFRHRGDTSPLVEDHTHEPLTQAINRPSMRALQVAFTIGAITDVPDPRLLDLLDEVLDVHGVDGLHARAILASRLPWLRHTAPDWFAERTPRIVGASAPDALGPATVDLYLEWGPPHPDLLLDQRDQVVAALGRERHEDAVRHLLHGLLWKLPGFEPAAVADVLVAAGDREISSAGHWLGWALADADLDVDVDPAVDLWRELLDRDLSPVAYAGFGWTAINTHLTDDDWLTLTEATARATAGALDEPHRVAERAGRTPADPRTARIIAALLADDPKPWDLQRIGAVGIQVLPAATGNAATELREHLLERGFYEARGA